jgi:hypothetical protein
MSRVGPDARISLRVIFFGRFVSAPSACIRCARPPGVGATRYRIVR